VKILRSIHFEIIGDKIVRTIFCSLIKVLQLRFFSLENNFEIK